MSQKSIKQQVIEKKPEIYYGKIMSLQKTKKASSGHVDRTEVSQIDFFDIQPLIFRIILDSGEII